MKYDDYIQSSTDEDFNKVRTLWNLPTMAKQERKCMKCGERFKSSSYRRCSTCRGFEKAYGVYNGFDLHFKGDKHGHKD